MWRSSHRNENSVCSKFTYGSDVCLDIDSGQQFKVCLNTVPASTRLCNCKFCGERHHLKDTLLTAQLVATGESTRCGLCVTKLSVAVSYIWYTDRFSLA